MAAATACGQTDDQGIEDTEPDPNIPVLPDDTTALLVIHALDIWGQELPAATALEITSASGDVTQQQVPVSYLALSHAADYEVSIVAPDHVPLTIRLRYDGAGTIDGFSQEDLSDARHGVAVRRELATLRPGQSAQPRFDVYLGARHRWFSSAGRPARRGNQVELLMDGQEAWASVHRDLLRATDSVLLATWWWESGFELIRDDARHAGLDDDERHANTILGVMDAIPAHKRVLVGQFMSQDGLLDWATADAPLRARGAAGGDRFEFMGQANETSGTLRFEVEAFSFGDRVRAGAGLESRSFDDEPVIASSVPAREVDLTDWPIDVDVQHASYHQKFAVIDSSVAYIGGMNLRRVDWDTSEHAVFDHRRMMFGATTSERQAVRDEEALPDMGPRKDYMVRIEGPSAQDAADVFKRRWDQLRFEGAEYADASSAFEIERDLPDAGDIQVQVTPTMPDPHWEHAIIETWFNAVANAERYIFIEDQYFRIPMLNDAIVTRMTEVPSLRLIVVTKPVNEWTDPGCEWTHKSDTLFETLFPDRYLTLQLRAFATQVTWGFDETESRFQNIDTHSKMLIVDDVFMSVGSANKNNRGAVYEGEMNAAVVDDVWVRDQRRRILANMLPAGTPATDDAEVWWQQLVDAAAHNQDVWEAWDDEGGDISLDGDPLPSAYTPAGFVYPLEFRTSDDCFIEGVGPDTA